MLHTYMYILYIWYATVETPSRYAENKALTLVRTHTSKVIICKQNNNEGNASTSQKMYQGEKFVLECSNICILDLGKHWGGAWALMEKRRLSG
jgi:hypothetical protein